MAVETLILFFVYTYGLGFTATSFVKNNENFLERQLMRIGIGLSMIPLIGLTLNLLRIPVDWKIILIVSLIYPAYYLIRHRPKPQLKLRITKTNLAIAALIIVFVANFYIYASGAFNYPYLENDDSWSHAQGIKFVSIEKTVFVDNPSPFHYLDPYPPSYDLLFGILHQTNSELYWTMKFFNALIIALSTVFFFFWVKELTKNSNKALFASFALLSIPAFMSHFIWGLSLAVPLYFVAFYAFERIQYDWKWWIVTALTMVTVLTSTPTHSTYFGLIFGIYLLTKLILERKLLLWHIVAQVSGLGLSVILWWAPMLLKYGFLGTLSGVGFSLGNLQEEGLEVALRGTGDRVYTLADFFIAQHQNMINNPVGVGLILMILTILGIVFIGIRYKHLLRKEYHWMVLTLVLFLFTLYAVNGARFTIKLSPFRTWMLFAIPVCILATEGAFGLMNVAKRSAGKIALWGVLLLLLVGIYYTSTAQKISVNTAQWPPGGFWTSGEELGAHIWMRENLPRGSWVFTYANSAPIIGMDMYLCHWCQDHHEYRKGRIVESAQDTYNWLKRNNYQYILIDGQTVQEFGENWTNTKIQGLAQSPQQFRPAFQNQGAIIFEVV